MGKGDKKSRRGKIVRGSHGVGRPRKKKRTSPVVEPITEKVRKTTKKAAPAPLAEEAEPKPAKKKTAPKAKKKEPAAEKVTAKKEVPEEKPDEPAESVKNEETPPEE
jgi:30S ribosomal protein S31